MHLKIIRFSTTSLHLLIREGFSVRLSMNVAKSYCRITENILNIKAATGVSGAFTQVPGSPHQSC